MERAPTDLRERNRRWAELRLLAETAAGPGDPAFEAALARVQQMTHWPRARVLAGLGLSPERDDPGG